MTPAELALIIIKQLEGVNIATAAALLKGYAALQPRPLAEYGDDYGTVLWWHFPVNEPPYVGQPSDDDWPGYHTHWTPIAVPVEPKETGND